MAAQFHCLVEQFPNQHLLVIGDLIADEFVYGEIARVSREAPVLILQHERTETMPGGAGNTACNIASLGARVTCLGVVGRDRSGRQLTLSLRERGVDTHGVHSIPHRTTPTKTRILAGSTHSPRQQVIRIDRDGPLALPAVANEWLIHRLQHILPKISGLVLSDYGYETIDHSILKLVRHWLQTHPIPVVADSRYRLHDFGGLTSATPNQDEAEKLIGERFQNIRQVLKKAEDLRETLGLQALLLTRGSDGMVLAQRSDPPITIEAIGSKEPVDVTGAGDTVIAVYTTALAAGATFEEAMKLANLAAGLVVMKRGTSTVGLDELKHALEHHVL